MKQYIGIPYENKGRNFNGCDCFGLVRLFYRNEYGSELPEVNDYLDASNGEDANKSLMNNKAGYVKVPFESREAGDILLLRVNGLPTHLGIVINDKNMIHTMKGCESVVEDYSSYKWNNRIEGIYRWVI